MDIRKSMVVNSTPLETRIALLENGLLQEVFIERKTQTSLVGHVFKGRVAKLLPGMQSAFVSIGTTKDGFLYLDDHYFRPVLDEESENDASELGAAESLPPTQALPPVREGEEILVQIVKDPIGAKGPRLSRHLSFPGRFLVFMPGIDHIGISRKITVPEERERLRELVRAYAQPGEGFIVRTAAIGEKDEDLISDVAFLRQLWIDVQNKTQKAVTPSLVWRDLDLLQKVLRDLFREEVHSFWVDTDDAFRSVTDFAQKLHPEWLPRVKRFTSDLPIFMAFGVEEEIQKASQAKVMLRSGGSIVLNQTEALVSVDVNTGKFVGKKDLEETVFLNNLEAIPEIVRQLRLRNLGGLVVIDFIDMMQPEHREKVLLRLAEELKRDRNHPKALGISEFGLVEMTRKRTGPSLDRQLSILCPQCNGSGRLPNPEAAAMNAYRELARLGGKLQGRSVSLRLHPSLAYSMQREIREGFNEIAEFQAFKLVWIETIDAPHHEILVEVDGQKLN